MIIGVYTFEVYIPYSHSLKEKRRVITSIKKRIQSKFNVSVAEVDFLELWQRGRIGVAMISGEKSVVDKTFEKIKLLLSEFHDISIMSEEISYV